jgi:hypothetical protein
MERSVCMHGRLVGIQASTSGSSASSHEHTVRRQGRSGHSGVPLHVWPSAWSACMHPQLTLCVHPLSHFAGAERLCGSVVCQEGGRPQEGSGWFPGGGDCSLDLHSEARAAGPPGSGGQDAQLQPGAPLAAVRGAAETGAGDCGEQGGSTGRRSERRPRGRESRRGFKGVMRFAGIKISTEPVSYAPISCLPAEAAAAGPSFGGRGAAAPAPPARGLKALGLPLDERGVVSLVHQSLSGIVGHNVHFRWAQLNASPLPLLW